MPRKVRRRAPTGKAASISKPPSLLGTSFPIEVLAIIFTYATDPSGDIDHPYWPTTAHWDSLLGASIAPDAYVVPTTEWALTNDLFVLRISHVCRLWRLAAITAHPLWCRIEFGYVGLVDLFLERSASLPFDIAIKFRDEDDTSLPMRPVKKSKHVAHKQKNSAMVQKARPSPGRIRRALPTAQEVQLPDAHERKADSTTQEPQVHKGKSTRFKALLQNIHRVRALYANFTDVWSSSRMAGRLLTRLAAARGPRLERMCLIGASIKQRRILAATNTDTVKPLPRLTHLSVDDSMDLCSIFRSATLTHLSIVGKLHHQDNVSNFGAILDLLSITPKLEVLKISAISSSRSLREQARVVLCPSLRNLVLQTSNINLARVLVMSIHGHPQLHIDLSDKYHVRTTDLPSLLFGNQELELDVAFPRCDWAVQSAQKVILGMSDGTVNWEVCTSPDTLISLSDSDDPADIFQGTPDLVLKTNIDAYTSLRPGRSYAVPGACRSAETCFQEAVRNIQKTFPLQNVSELVCWARSPLATLESPGLLKALMTPSMTCLRRIIVDIMDARDNIYRDRTLFRHLGHRTADGFACPNLESIVLRASAEVEWTEMWDSDDEAVGYNAQDEPHVLAANYDLKEMVACLEKRKEKKRPINEIEIWCYDPRLETLYEEHQVVLPPLLERFVFIRMGYAEEDLAEYKRNWEARKKARKALDADWSAGESGSEYDSDD